MQKVLPVFDHSQSPNVGRMPSWVRQSLGKGLYGTTAKIVSDNTLHTVCESAKCPNRGECWSHGMATFMLLGDVCTRACGFCAVKTGKPFWHDEDEPQRVAAAVTRMGLDYVVLTSVNRGDLRDGGAGVFANTLAVLRTKNTALGLEILTPDFHRCQVQAVEVIYAAVSAASPQQSQQPILVWGHNVETVPALYQQVRKGSDYVRSLKLLSLAGQCKGVETKSSLMLGLGESCSQVLDVMQDLYDAGVTRLALGQYLRPSRYHLPVQRYLAPTEFELFAEQARAMGFSWVKSGPMVRSSYHAEERQDASDPVQPTSRGIYG